MNATQRLIADSLVAGRAANVLYAWEQGQVTGEEAMQALQRVFASPEGLREVYLLHTAVAT
jgi:hypothetical protein